MPIEGLSARKRLPRIGKIHLGIRDPEKGYPKKVDYFVCPPEVQKVFGDKPKELRILIPTDDEERFASQYYRCYSKTRGLICKGDGIIATRMTDTQTGALADRDSKEIVMREIPCLGRKCPDYKIKCKEVMNLQFLLPEVPGLGVWQIDTSSINSILNINSAVELIKEIYKRIAMLPLSLTLESKEVVNPEDHKKQTVYVLNLRTNATMLDLAMAARQQAEVLELPVGDDERPDLIAPEFEPDVAELPPELNHKPVTEKDIDELFGKKSEGHPEVVVPSKTSKGKPKEDKQLEVGVDMDWLKSAMKKIHWGEVTAIGWIGANLKVKGKNLDEVLGLMNQEQKSKFVEHIRSLEEVA